MSDEVVGRCLRCGHGFEAGDPTLYGDACPGCGGKGLQVLNVDEWLRLVRCGCGKIWERAERDAEVPCPACGSRYYAGSGSSNVPPGTEVHASGTSGGREFARWSGSEGNTRADSGVDYLTASAQTPASHNEDGTLEAAEALIMELRRQSERWGAPRIVLDDEADCEAHAPGVECTVAPCSRPDHRPLLRVQVVRVPRDRSFWQALDPSRPVASSWTTEEAIEEVKALISLKAAQYPVSQLAGLDLVLSARHVELFTFGEVVQSFRASYGNWARQSGFHRVWVVGRPGGHTARLDSAP